MSTIRRFSLRALFAGVGFIALSLGLRAVSLEHIHLQHRIISKIAGFAPENALSYEEGALTLQNDGALTVSVDLRRVRDWRKWLAAGEPLMEVAAVTIWSSASRVDPNEDECTQVDRVDSLLTDIQQLTTISELTIGPNVSDRQLEIISHFPAITSLYVRSDRYDSALTDLSLKRFSKLKTLRSLSVYSPAISDDGVSALATLSELEYLTVCSPKLAGSFVSSLSSFTKLRGLEVRCGTLSTTFFHELPKISTIVALQIGLLDDHEVFKKDNAEFNSEKSIPLIARITDESAASIANLPHLTFLVLQNINLSDEAFSAICERRSLEFIHLDNVLTATVSGLCALSDASAEQECFDALRLNVDVLLSLAKCSNLRSLEIRKTPLHQSEIDALCRISALKELRISNGRINNEQLMQLQSALPGAIVTAY